MAKYHLLAFLPLIFLGTILLRGTHSFFNDAAVASTNTFTAAAVFPSATPTPTGAEVPASPSGHLIINEVFQSSSNSAEWVEIYNPTSSAVNVSGWAISDNNESDTFPTVTPIPAGSFAVVITSSSVVSVPAGPIQIRLADTTIGGGLAAGGDRVGLSEPSLTIIDSMSYGTDLTFLNPAAPAPGVGQSVRRIPNGTDTNSAADWKVGSSSIGLIN